MDQAAKAIDLTIIERLQCEVSQLKSCSIIEVMMENPNVKAHVLEWEKRALDAEAELTILRARLSRMEKALREAIDERDTELDTMICRYPFGSPEGVAWQAGVHEVWKRLDVIKGRMKDALTKEGAA